MRGVLAILALGALGCAAFAPPRGGASPPSPVDLGIANGTTLDVTLFVNDVRVGVYPPDHPSPSIDPASLPPLPWDVEARSPSGRVLTSMHIKPGQIRTIVRAGDVTENVGAMGRVDLSCGRLTIWAGDFIPSGGPIPLRSLGTPGDCEP